MTLVLASAYSVSLHITENGGVTFASNIANKYGEAGSVGQRAGGRRPRERPAWRTRWRRS